MGAPLVSFGVPVRNGAAWIEQTLNDLLGQTVTDLEVVVSDNASTDGTTDIIARIARADRRVRLHAAQRDMGPAANYNRVFALSSGRFFAWAAADDRHAPGWAKACLEALQGDDEAVLAQSRTLVVDERDARRQPFTVEPLLDQRRPAERLAAFLSLDRRRHSGFEIFGLVRRPVLERVGPQGSYASADRVLLARLLLAGKFLLVPGGLFLNREHAGRSMQTSPSRGHRGKSTVARLLGGGPAPGDEWWNPDLRGRMVFPEWREIGEYARAVHESGLPPRERRECQRLVVGFALRNAHKLGRDVGIGLEQAARALRERAVG